MAQILQPKTVVARKKYRTTEHGDVFPGGQGKFHVFGRNPRYNMNMTSCGMIIGTSEAAIPYWVYRPFYEVKTDDMCQKCIGMLQLVD